MSISANSATISILQKEVPKGLQNALGDLSYNLDAYGNLSIEIKHKEQLHKLDNIKQVAETDFQNRGIYIRLPLTNASLGAEIERKGFELYQLDRSKKEITFLFRNGRAIPYVDTAFVTASIFIIRIDSQGNKQLLVIDEEDKKDLTVPAGCVDGGELALTAAIRETKEEIGLDLKPSDIKLYSIRNRTFKETNRNHVDFNFVTIVPFDSKINVDGKEVLNYTWIPLSEDALKTTKAFGKSLSPLYVDAIISCDDVGLIHMLNDTHFVVKLKKGLP